MANPYIWDRYWITPILNSRFPVMCLGWDSWDRKDWRYNYCYFMNKNSCNNFFLIVVTPKICNKPKVKFSYKIMSYCYICYYTNIIIVVLILDWNTRFGSERGTSSGTDWVAETKRSICTSSLMTSFMCIFFFTVSVVESSILFMWGCSFYYVYALSPLWMESWNVTIYWAVLSFGTVCHAVLVVLTFESVDQFILKCDSFNWKPWAVLSCGRGF